VDALKSLFPTKSLGLVSVKEKCFLSTGNEPSTEKKRSILGPHFGNY